MPSFRAPRSGEPGIQRPRGSASPPGFRVRAKARARNDAVEWRDARPPPYCDFAAGLIPISCAIAATTARCWSIEAANSAGAAGADDLAGGEQAGGDRGVGGGRLHVGGDAVAEVGGEIARPEQADQAVVFQRGKAGLGDGRERSARRGARVVLLKAISRALPACTCGRTIASAPQ